MQYFPVLRPYEFALSTVRRVLFDILYSLIKLESVEWFGAFLLCKGTTPQFMQTTNFCTFQLNFQQWIVQLKHAVLRKLQDRFKDNKYGEAIDLVHNIHWHTLCLYDVASRQWCSADHVECKLRID